ncbi:MAG TPA: hypothetical protein V6C98_06665 [Thermosynechococcaceae cyanobacterium]
MKHPKSQRLRDTQLIIDRLLLTKMPLVRIALRLQMSESWLQQAVPHLAL